MNSVLHAAVGGPRFLELGVFAAHRDHAGAKDIEDGLLLVGPDVWLRDRDHAEVCRPSREWSPSIS